MRLSYIRVGWQMAAREIGRSRIALILLFVIPTLFYALVALTTSTRQVAFRLAAVAGAPNVAVSAQRQALIFMGLTAVGLLTSFLALVLVQKHAPANRRLVLAGYRPSELILSKLALLGCVVALIGSYVAAMLLLFFPPEHLGLLVVGFMLGGYVYGCYGLLVGSVVRQELEGILLVVLLANIDVGWLQNPLFYAEAQNKAIIRHLPAFFPAQASMIAAFTDHPVTVPVLGSLAYGSSLLVIAMLLYWRKMRVHP
jgi:hypothetical protein